MTDTISYEIDPELDSQVLQWYKKSMSEIQDIDEVLDAGSEEATKRKFTSERVSQYEASWKKVTDQLIPQLDEMLENQQLDKLVGAYSGLIRALQAKFRKPIETYVTAQVESQPKPEDTVSDEDKKQLSATRSELAKKVKTLVDMATNFGECDRDNPWALPKKRGAVGKRGPRALSLYTWTVDGEKLEGEEDNQGGVAEKVGFAKQSELTAAMKEVDFNGKKFDTTNPPERFEIVVNGHTVSGERESDNEEETTEVSPENEEV